mgnify:CR=1 FL=1
MGGIKEMKNEDEWLANTIGFFLFAILVLVSMILR